MLPESPVIALTAIRMVDGTSLSLSDSDLVVLTGPNNSGKSLFLRELVATLRSGDLEHHKIVRGTDYACQFKHAELVRYLERTFGRNTANGQLKLGLGYEAPDSWLAALTARDISLEFASSLFVDFVQTSARIEGSNPAPVYDRTTEFPANPIQLMFQHDSIEQAVSDQFKAAFDEDLIVHRQAKTNIPLYVGTRPKFKKGENWASTEYLARLETLTRLEDQGDGMRSFTTVVGAIVANNRPILLIDEPEAFLHPPQARLLGRIIANERRSARQVIVATHSADFIKGVMESSPKSLHFGRITRQSGIHWIKPADTKIFITDPLLRTTNALDAVLHDEVILTEADRDSVFYQAMLDAVSASRRDRLFLHTGGKHRLAHLVAALRRLGVAPKSIVDIDILRTGDVLSSLLKAYGSGAANILDKAEQIRKEVEQHSSPLPGSAFRSKIEEALGKISNENAAVPKDVIKAIEQILTSVSPWSTVKSVGKNYFRGNAAKSFAELRLALAHLNIWVVPEGELEGFLRPGPSKGQRWLDDALSRDMATDPDLEAARKFVGEVFS